MCHKVQSCLGGHVSHSRKSRAHLDVSDIPRYVSEGNSSLVRKPVHRVVSKEKDIPLFCCYDIIENTVAGKHCCVHFANFFCVVQGETHSCFPETLSHVFSRIEKTPFIILESVQLELFIQTAVYLLRSNINQSRILLLGFG
jgi:hypothetical protein